MASGRFRHVPVMDNGRLAGIVSIGDVVKYRLAEMAFEFECTAAVHSDGVIAIALLNLQSWQVFRGGDDAFHAP